MPRAIDQVGFEPALLTPRISLAEKRRWLARIGQLRRRAMPAPWAPAFCASSHPGWSGGRDQRALPCGDSPRLSEYPADIPWDERGLFEALLAPRHRG
ncbi:MAG TPA: hypothetical protein VLU54_13775 [Casimicrobiaceae bacterium]|nr:hypothetical protein [Casimicrobiaceae bacterium]